MKRTNPDDARTLAVVITKLNQEHIPRLVRMKERLDRGEKLSDVEINDLKRIYDSTMKDSKLVERNPEFLEVSMRYVELYTAVLNKALELEKQS